MDIKSLTEFDWRSLNRFLSPKAADDFNAFLEKLPQNTSNTSLVILAVVWSFAAALGLYTTVKMQEFAEITVERDESKALLPVVPKIQNTAVSSKIITTFVEELAEIYKGLEIKANSSIIIIRAKSTAQYGQFREAIGHIQNGGLGWQISVDRLCVGKDCTQYPLSASLKVNTVSIKK